MVGSSLSVIAEDGGRPHGAAPTRWKDLPIQSQWPAALSLPQPAARRAQVGEAGGGARQPLGEDRRVLADAEAQVILVAEGRAGREHDAVFARQAIGEIARG